VTSGTSWSNALAAIQASAVSRPAPGRLGRDHHLGPLAAKVWAGRYNREAGAEKVQPVNALGTPPVQQRPTLKLGHRHKGDAAGAPGQIRMIELPDGVVLEEERERRCRR